MSSPTPEDKERRNQKDRDRRKARGLKPRGDGGGPGKGQGRKLNDTDRPTCCGVLMGSWGDRRWRCRGECKKFKPKGGTIDD